MTMSKSQDAAVETFDGDPIRGYSTDHRFWSTANIGEAAPDVMTPLDWSLWGPGNELAVLSTWYRLGMLGPDDVAVDDDQNNRLTGIFYGRQAMNIDVIRPMMDRFPGLSADAFELGLAGSVRSDAQPFPALTDYQHELVAARVSEVGATHAQRLADLAAEQAEWWVREVFERTDPGDPLARLVESFDRFVHAIGVHNETRLLSAAVMTTVYTLAAIADRLDAVPAVFAAFGGVAELSMADDMWALATGELDRATFLRRHGYHGENEGNPTGRAWREDPSRLDGLIEALRTRGAEEHPARRAQRAVEAREAAVAELQARLGDPAQREELRAALELAAPSVRETEIGKGAFLMAIDGFRAAARDLGKALVGTGRLDQLDDVFFLTLDELRHDDGRDLRAHVEFRRQRWSEYRSYSLDRTFIGMPHPHVNAAARAAVGDVLAGIAASTGVHEGRVRVISRSDADVELEPGDVLVCASTDPSWTPVFLLVDAVVIDIGSVASHGAIVARELGLPAVINTGDGSRRLRDGDVVRVDGGNGTVTVVSQAGLP
jgi:phosphohistidine swiveling domain-containing protein